MMYPKKIKSKLFTATAVALTSTEAVAAVPAIGELGPFPILQLFGGILTLGFLAIGLFFWARGESGKNREPPKSDGSGTVAYMMGPMQQVFELLQQIHKGLDAILAVGLDMARIRTEFDNYRAECTKTNDETRRMLREEIKAAEARLVERIAANYDDAHGDGKDLEERLRRVEIELGPARGTRTRQT